MSIARNYKCDLCQKEKGPNNHWYTASDLFPQNGDSVNSESIGIHRWPRYKDADNVKHLCGAECVIRYVQTFLGAK